MTKNYYQSKIGLSQSQKVSMGVVRTTYLIDENGIIIKAFDKVRAADNPAQMLGVLE